MFTVDIKLPTMQNRFKKQSVAVGEVENAQPGVAKIWS